MVGEEEWEVEEILNPRITGRKKQLQYRVKWKTNCSHGHRAFNPLVPFDKPVPERTTQGLPSTPLSSLLLFCSPSLRLCTTAFKRRLLF
ncbi:uncharacterized protein ARB_04025 [Trichophyton benhamiae CBS 112371]|uniref:Chromo domain-containing protein n=1 Tax=Arthroderma benhamiae (strain ATCC MYA-4681 / CBS 112371) TaxID=663331 RepID=D4AID1_ARTBC|nr:uncharacterized protein ARB_04025 [Trichophyton benhamiae CBS 112371]EFE36504.1 hypothetical protein ARB_04025 [Trichophyton benhamiae CBS 112371]